jgi:hypothetical protein
MAQFALEDILGYERICKDMQGYDTISFENKDMNGDHIQEKISNQDILINPFISRYILVYIHARYPYSYLPKLTNVYPVYPLLSKFSIQRKYTK